MPQDIPLVEVVVGDAQSIPLVTIIKDAGLTGSTSEARRMIKQGAVKLDQARVTDLDLALRAGAEVVLQVGKRRYARVRLN